MALPEWGVLVPPTRKEYPFGTPEYPPFWGVPSFFSRSWVPPILGGTHPKRSKSEVPPSTPHCWGYSPEFLEKTPKFSRACGAMVYWIAFYNIFHYFLHFFWISGIFRIPLLLSGKAKQGEPYNGQIPIILIYFSKNTTDFPVAFPQEEVGTQGRQGEP